MEVVGGQPFRAQAKRREAYAGDESAPGGEVQYSQVLRVYGRRDGCRDLLILPGEICWASRRGVGRRTKGRKLK